MPFFNEIFQLISFFNDKDNIFLCTKLHIYICSFDPRCTTSNVWKYEVMPSLLSVTDADDVCTSSNRPTIIPSILVSSTNARDTTHVHSNLVRTDISNNVRVSWYRYAYGDISVET